ncbi:MAG: Hsp70 family protein [Candidatus Hydrothermia bacterium]|jgi:hypothetical protein
MFYIGLDFGTYTTKVAFLKDNQTEPNLLNLEGLSDNKGFIYSFIDLESDEIGLPAYDKYKNGKGNVKYGFKLRMMEEEGKQLCIKFLSKIREKIEKIKEEEIKDDIRIMFSAPNSWFVGRQENETYKEILREAGFEVNDSVIVREPYASALYHLVSDEIKHLNKKVLVIDAGAGTIDMLIVNVFGKGVEYVKGSEKFYNRGGIEVDKIIKEKYELSSLYEAERLKFTASYWFGKGRDFCDFGEENKIIIKREEFEEILSDWIKELRNCLEEYKKFEFDYILITGGFGRFYIFEKLIREIFKEKEILPHKKDSYFKDKDFIKDASVSFGCAMESSGKFKTIINVQVNVYLVLESSIGIKEVYYDDKKCNFESKGHGKYEILLFNKDETLPVEKYLKNFKINQKPLEVELDKVFYISIETPNEKKEIPIVIQKYEKVKNKKVENLKFKITNDREFKVVFIDQNGNEDELSSKQLREIMGG